MKTRSPSSRSSFVVVVACAGAAAVGWSTSAWAAPQGEAKALKASADRSLVRERFCDATYLYKKLDEMQPTPENLLAASDAAGQGGDRAGAVRFLETFQSRHASHRLAASVATRLELLRAAIAKYGAGAACTDPAPECGNGAFESGEDCDDGNRVDADQCPITCKLSGSAAVVTPPPAVLPPTKPTKPVKPEPVKPEPVKVEPARIDERVDEEDEEDKEPADVAAEPTTTEPTTTTTTTTTPTTTPTPPTTTPPTTTRDDEAGDEDTDDKVRSIDDEVPPPPGAGPPIGGFILSGLGGVVLVAGGATAVYGALPFVRYAQNVPQQTTVQLEYQAAEGASQKRQAAGRAADLRAALVKDANDWNQTFRWVATAGGAAAAIGAGALVGGIILIASGGDEPDEDADEAADEADVETTTDKEESDR